MALLALELGLYHVGDFGKRTLKERTARYGWEIVPSQSKWGLDSNAREWINAHGFRDERDWSFAERGSGRDGRLLKVAVLGNSLTYGSGVAAQDTWPRVLESLLGERVDELGSDADLIVMNFAVEGYTVEQMARIYEDKIRPFEPDVLVWATVAKDLRFVDLDREPPSTEKRTRVSRTATFAMLRRYVMNSWIPLPRNRPRPAVNNEQEDFWKALLSGVQWALLEELGAEHGAAAYQRMTAIAGQRLAGATQVEMPGRFVECFEEVADEFVETDRKGDFVLRLWAVFESCLSPAMWKVLEADIVPNPFAPKYEAIWRIRGYRVGSIAAELEARSATLAVVVIPTIIQVLNRPPSPLVYWRDVWHPQILESGLSPLVIDATVDYLTQMATLGEEIRNRGYIWEGERRRIGLDYAGAESSLARLDDPWHYSEAGHRVVATEVFRDLVDARVIERTLSLPRFSEAHGN